jgi:16S rRNA (cytosine967-C5)-methyltransferase
VRPAARLQALTDLLNTVLLDATPADRIMQNWGRQNRYAGSKDRRDISNRLFAILRHYGTLTARLEADDPLLVCLLATIVLEGESPEAAMALADGSAHAPDPLEAAQVEALTQALARDGTQTKAGLCSVPEWLMGDIEAQLGEQTQAVLLAMLERAPVDVRVNLLKTDREAAMTALQEEGFEPMPHPHIDTGLRFEGAPRLVDSEAFKQGLIEVQDAGAQGVAQICDARPGQTVMDFCAGAGGKALALAAQMENQGVLLVHDAIAGRMNGQRPRAKRAGVDILQIVKPAQVLDFTESCHLVVADVPCSGTGRWRRSPETKWRLTPEDLAELHQLQADILTEAALLVQPSGRLVYITCSLLASENDQQIEAFLQETPSFQRVETVLPFGSAGQTQLHPLNSDTDGLYCAVLQNLSTS